MIRVAADADPEFVDYALGLIARFLGIEISRVSGGSCDVLYADAGDRECAIRIPRVDEYTETDVPEAPDRVTSAAGATFPFDLFAAIRFWLCDRGGAAAPDRAFDRHDRMGYADSIHERRGLRDVPIVNRYMLAFGDWLEARCGISCAGGLPDGRRALIALSHDVDEPIDPDDRSHNRRFVLALLRHAAARALRGRIRDAASIGRTLQKWTAKRRGSRGERHWLFHEVLDAEARHGFHSSFFFAVKTIHDPDGSLYDVAYDFSDPRFAPVYREIVARGSEIGLHISYDARESHERIARERTALERVATAPVRGSRHHFWHMQRPFWQTLADHGRAGLRYDSSIAFNESPGYRLGIGFPFRPWDPGSGRTLPTLQIPTFVMDSSLFQTPGADVDSAVAEFSRLLDGLKAHRGVAAIDWHVRTSFPGSRANDRMGRTYLEILDLLASDPEVGVGSCAEIAARFDPTT